MARPRRAQPAPAPAPETRRSLLDRIRDAPKLAASLGAIVALIAGVIGLWRVAFPAQPQPGGKILEVIRDPNVPLGEFLRTAGAKTDTYTAAQLRSAGNVFTVKTEVLGVLSLHWTMFDADSSRALPQKAYSNQRAATIRAKESAQTGSSPVWIPLPPRAGRFFVRFQLFDSKGEIRDTFDDKPFAMTAPG